MEGNLYPRQLARNQPNPAQVVPRRQEAAGQNKLTRYDIINKNYIFPQDKYAVESSYKGSYTDTSNARVRTEKVNYPENQVLPKGRFEGGSSYLNDFEGGQGGRGELIKHGGELKIGGKFEGQSNYLQNYGTKGQGGRQEKVTFPDNQLMPEGKFETISTYAGNYVNNPPQYVPKIKPSSELKVAGGALQGQSSYVADYYNKENVARSQKAIFPQNEVIPRGGFEGVSTYQGTYIKNGEGGKNVAIRPQGELKVGGQFYGESSYANNYYDKGLGGRQEKFKLPSNKVLPEGKFEDGTTYGNNYVQSPIKRVDKCKLQGELKVGGRFEGGSSYSNDYAQKGDSRRQRVQYKDNQIFSKGGFVGGSTYQQNYVQNQFSINKAIKPEEQLKVGGRFEGESNYAHNYRDKGVIGRSEKVVMPANQVMPEGRFEGRSTYENSYPLGERGERREQHRPQNNLGVGNVGRFEGNSSYSIEMDPRVEGPRYLSRQSEFTGNKK